MAAAITNLKRWQKFLAGKKPRLLSPEEIWGLFAELTFLHTLLDKHVNQSDVIDAWLGPTGADQDFVFGNVAAEVKALSNSAPPNVRIASENQLESSADYFFLVVTRLVQQSESNMAHSLNELVNMVGATLAKGPVLDKFQAKLAMAGYIELYHYNSPSLQVADTRAYRVVGRFPRITPSTLDSGISHVRYQLRTDAIKPFECPFEAIWEAN